MNNLAGCYMLLRKTDMAVSLGEETLRLSRARLGSDHPLTLSCMGNLAAFYRSAGAVDQGLALQEETLRLMRTKLGPDHPNTLVSMNNLASDYRAVGRLDRALPLFEDAAHGMQARNFQHVHARRIVPNTIACLEAMNLFERAEAWRRKWLPVVKNGAGAASPAYMTQLAGLGTNLMMQGKWADAEPVLRECLAIREKQEPDAWTTSNTKSALGGSLLGQKKYAEAEPLLLAGYEGMKQRADKIPANGKARLPEAASRLVGLCAATGRPAEAARWLDETWAWAETTPDAKP
jgi:tetratricopeptide (TPR) repeat protein